MKANNPQLRREEQEYKDLCESPNKKKKIMGKEWRNLLY